MVTDRWTTRDLPVLTAVVEMNEEGDTAPLPGKVAERAGVAPEDAKKALIRLARADPPYIKAAISWGDEAVRVTDIYERALRATEYWPTAESVANKMVTALYAASDRESDPDQKGRLRKTAEWFGGAGRDFAVEVGAAVVSRQMSGG